MVDYKVLDDIIDKDDINACKDNLFEIFGELFNGETLKIVLSEIEGDIKEENKVTLPKGMEEFDKLSFNKNKSTFGVILNLFINLIMLLNPKKHERDEVYYLKIALTVITCLNGTIATNKNYITSDTVFDIDYIKQNRKKIKKEDLEECEKVKSYFSIAYNFLAFSTINYIRFNHHFPTEKTHIIRKVLMKLGEEITNELIEEDNKSTFYNVLVSAARINNEVVFYEKVLNKSKEKLHNLKFKYYGILGNINADYADEMVKLRIESTPNGFLILDIIQTMISDIKSKNLLFLLPNIESFGELLKIREYIRMNPFNFHPSRYFFKVNNGEYDKIREKFLSLMATVGGIVYYYTENMEDSVVQAKCRNKYANKVNYKDKQVVEFMSKLDEVKVSIKEDDIRTMREKMGKIDFEINEETDINSLNKKANSILEKIINDKKIF